MDGEFLAADVEGVESVGQQHNTVARYMKGLKKMEDDEIMKKSGIYRYVLSGDLRDLSFRTFDKKQKREAYECQQGICTHCQQYFELEDMEADHITPWKEGGTTVADNCQMLCHTCNRIKGAR